MTNEHIIQIQKQGIKAAEQDQPPQSPRSALGMGINNSIELNSTQLNEKSLMLIKEVLNAPQPESQLQKHKDEYGIQALDANQQFLLKAKFIKLHLVTGTHPIHNLI